MKIIKFRKLGMIPKHTRVRWVMANQKLLWQAGWFYKAFYNAYWSELT